MTNEIKEIINNLIEYRNSDYKCKQPEDCLTIEDVWLLLDYITNLQEENEKLKELKYKFFDCSGDEESFTLEDYLELGNKLYDLQEEKQRLLESADCLSKGYGKLEQRIDKAVDYIKNNYDFYYGDDLIDEYQELVNILRGDE